MKLELEKKKAASAKKFKEASKAQADIKEAQQLQEEAQKRLVAVNTERTDIDKDILAKEKEIR